MRALFKLIILSLFAVPLALALAGCLAVDSAPIINRTAEITPASVERAKRILDQNDPRKLKSGARRTIAVGAGDVDLALNYLAHRYGGGSARVELTKGRAQVAASVRLPRLPIGLFINVVATVIQQPSLPAIAKLQIGQLSIPAWLANWLLARAPGLIRADLDSRLLHKFVRNISINERAVTLTYQWQEDALKTLRAAVLPAKDQQRIAIYQDLLVNVSQKLKRKQISLVDLLVPFFQLANERSADNDAGSENRAAILVLAAYVNGKDIEQILPELGSQRRPAQHQVTLSRRDDFAKHFIVSAALAASAGSPLANAVGLYKEIDDSRGGSGFSFNDIAADRAGVQFGAQATQSAAAQPLQIKIGAGIAEPDIMPQTADLPEFMPEAEFKRRFGGVDGAGYKKMMAEIERRIAALPLYR